MGATIRRGDAKLIQHAAHHPLSIPKQGFDNPLVTSYSVSLFSCDTILRQRRLKDITMSTKEQILKYNQNYRAKPGVKEARAKLNRDWIAKNRTRYNEAKREYRFKLKLDALAYYSKGTMDCNNCGYNADTDALCLDHINDNGSEHRKQLGCSSRGNANGTTIYERLKAKGWMDGFQVLCFNCNTIKELRRKRNGKTSIQMKFDIKYPKGWCNKLVEQGGI